MFARQWLRAVLRAGGVVLVVPIGLLLAATLAAALGGSSLDGIGQVLGGPQVPSGQAVAAETDRDRSGELGLPNARRERPARAAPRRRTAVASRVAGVGGPRVRRVTRAPAPPATSRPTQRRPPRRTRAPRPARTPPSPVAPAASSPPSAPAPPPAATAPPDVVRGLGEVLDDTVRPVAPPVADAVGSVVDLLAPPR